ncbi:MAG TPA: cation:proton antiporter [Bryobacteraceae bacterium]|jgi:Kef-type K+ transport system membrane component KefB|nr:cation:proton antiporter [Bryobacteraceae bacterium]
MHFVHAEAAHLPLMLLLVFGTAKIAAELFERIGQPGLVGEILAGVLLGPSVLNWVQPDAILSALAELGVMFLLFRVGLEIKGSELFKVGKTAMLVAIAGVLLPFAAGAALSVAFGQNRIEAIFVGAAAVATSVGITAQVLAVKGLLDERASQVILAAAVIDDILGLLVLAVVSGMAESHIDIPGLLTTAAIAVAFTFLVARFGTSTVRRWYPTIERRLAARESQFHFALICVFALSLLAVYVGVAAIVGSFLAGMAFSEASDRRMQDLAHGATELLVPFFLVGIGLQFNLASFRETSTIIFSAALTLIAILTKLIGCGLPALVYGRRDAVRVGIGMVPRGEVGMIVAQIGLGLGVVGAPVYAAVVCMALLTTLVTPPLLNYAFRDCKPQVAKEEFGLV